MWREGFFDFWWFDILESLFNSDLIMAFSVGDQFSMVAWPLLEWKMFCILIFESLFLIFLLYFVMVQYKVGNKDCILGGFLGSGVVFQFYYLLFFYGIWTAHVFPFFGFSNVDLFWFMYDTIKMESSFMLFRQISRIGGCAWCT